MNKKPEVSTVARKVKLYSNLFKINSAPESLVTSFTIDIQPELPVDDPLTAKLIFLALPVLQKKLSFPVILGLQIFLAGDKS